MSGLREQQKLARKQAIAQSAVRLFEQQGFSATTVEQIAREAGVSSPTVFKYFSSKQEILLEMLREQDHKAIVDVTEIIDQFDDPLDAMCELERRLITNSLQILPAAFWREVLPIILTGGNNELPEAYQASNAQLQREIQHLLERLQKRGKLRADADIASAAFLLNDYSHLQLLRLVSKDPLDMETHFRQVRKISALVLHGLQTP
ncbi:helix-turn-helix domain containing protein [Pokkaliibacter sp. MBI-7]|uniref:TetR/AcrR family transcriptional regulator n=1 Tax=Pokkaliibacter sp. MBI-7 TaxID=3040600 RepID=UPI00244D78D3|nr:helix-turn-helix domain containing protein [Pokkaliibacter sp. MBI-7]MDH2435466.1 helix-turn-helix domain containing protein [Pokkaliibacter sp. MBI-7]